MENLKGYMTKEIKDGYSLEFCNNNDFYLIHEGYNKMIVLQKNGEVIKTTKTINPLLKRLKKEEITQINIDNRWFYLDYLVDDFNDEKYNLILTEDEIRMNFEQLKKENEQLKKDTEELYDILRHYTNKCFRRRYNRAENN